MPKLRNADTDIGMFTQWLGRKCRNHNPLQELKLDRQQRAAKANIYTSKTVGDLSITGADRNVLIYAAGNRVFTVTVNEVETPEQLAEIQASGELVKVES